MIYYHDDLLSSPWEEAINKRITLILEQILIKGLPLRLKPCAGDNRQWWRTPLQGNHYYLWFSNGKRLSFNEQIPSLFLRDIRHHDDHSPLHAGALSDYHPLEAQDIFGQHQDFASYYTPEQQQFILEQTAFKLLKGGPGTGKTTILLHAVRKLDEKSVLYLSYSSELAIAAERFFQAIPRADQTVLCYSWYHWLQLLLGQPLPTHEEDSMQALQNIFQKRAHAYPQWQEPLFQRTLFHELRTYFWGFNEADSNSYTLLSPRRYLSRREAILGRKVAHEALRLVEFMHKEGRTNELFPWLSAARKLAEKPHLARKNFSDVTAIVIDEVQDLTPIEWLALLEVAKALTIKTLLIAGDEGQTVLGTDFSWERLQETIKQYQNALHLTELQGNVRSPLPITELVIRLGNLYRLLESDSRPENNQTPGRNDLEGNVFILFLEKTETWQDDLVKLTSDEQWAVISVERRQKNYPIKTVFDAKGLDFKNVIVLGLSQWLQQFNRIEGEFLQDRRVGGIGALLLREMIDELRVAFSRATENLYLVLNPEDLEKTAWHFHTQQLITWLQDYPPQDFSELTIDFSKLEPSEQLGHLLTIVRRELVRNPKQSYQRLLHAIDLYEQFSALVEDFGEQSFFTLLAELMMQHFASKASLTPQDWQIFPKIFEKIKKFYPGAELLFFYDLAEHIEKMAGQPLTAEAIQTFLDLLPQTAKNIAWLRAYLLQLGSLWMPFLEQWLISEPYQTERWALLQQAEIWLLGQALTVQSYQEKRHLVEARIDAQWWKAALHQQDRRLFTHYLFERPKDMLPPLQEQEAKAWLGFFQAETYALATFAQVSETENKKISAGLTYLSLKFQPIIEKAHLHKSILLQVISEIAKIYWLNNEKVTSLKEKSLYFKKIYALENAIADAAYDLFFSSPVVKQQWQGLENTFINYFRLIDEKNYQQAQKSFADLSLLKQYRDLPRQFYDWFVDDRRQIVSEKDEKLARKMRDLFDNFWSFRSGSLKKLTEEYYKTYKNQSWRIDSMRLFEFLLALRWLSVNSTLELITPQQRFTLSVHPLQKKPIDWVRLDAGERIYNYENNILIINEKIQKLRFLDEMPSAALAYRDSKSFIARHPDVALCFAEEICVYRLNNHGRRQERFSVQLPESISAAKIEHWDYHRGQLVIATSEKLYFYEQETSGKKTRWHDLTYSKTNNFERLSNQPREKTWLKFLPGQRSQGLLWREGRMQRFFWHNQQQTLLLEEHYVDCPAIEQASFSANGEWLVCTHPNALLSVWWLLERKLERIQQAKLPAGKVIDFLLVHPNVPLFTLQVGQEVLLIQLSESNKKVSLQQALDRHFDA